MKRFGPSAAVAFALANLYLLFLTGPLVSPQHQLIFHLPGSATALFVPVILDLMVLTVALTAILLWAQRRPRAEMAVWAVLLFPLPLILIETIASFAGRPAAPGLVWATVVLAVGGWATVAWRTRAAAAAFRRWRRLLVTLLSFVSLSGGIILLQLLWLGWKGRDLNRPFVPRRQAAATASPASDAAGNGTAGSPGSRRIVWIILDELSYRQVYGHRAPGLALPNFDRLAEEATVFTQASPTATFTRIAVPALLTGKAVNATVPSADGQQLLLHLRGQKGWHPMRPEDTVFADAAAAGVSTSVAGWYEPYCRLLPAVLDRCFWMYSDNIPGGLTGEASIGSNAVAPLREAVQSAFASVGWQREPVGEDQADVRRHEGDYRALLEAGDQLLRQQSEGLTLLHMPIPHPWGFYDRRHGSFPGHRTSYLDNLALADAYLGHVRELLEANGSWENTDVLIMGDHGWRTESVWRRSGFWTPEEEAASRQAPPNDAPAVVLKLHGQHAGAQLRTPFRAVHTRALIDTLLHRRLQTAADLQQWAAETEGR